LLAALYDKDVAAPWQNKAEKGGCDLRSWDGARVNEWRLGRAEREPAVHP